MATKEQKALFNQIYLEAKNAGIAHPEVVAAQWAVESAWGTKQSGKNNFFGIKAGNGDPNNNEKGTIRWTKENINGKDVRIQQKFRDYDSLSGSLLDRAKFLQENPRYRKAGYFEASSPAEAARILQKAGYATDPNYANTLIDVMKSAGVNPNDGQQYDYSTTQPQNIALMPQQNQSITLAPQPELPTIKPLSSFTDNFNQVNNTDEEIIVEPPKPKQKYQKQLAAAFGVEPEPDNIVPGFDVISDLMKSIWDNTA